MSRATLLDAKNSRMPAILNISGSDSRFVQYLNDATENLVKTGESFWGLHGRFQFCLADGCITLPRQIAAVESVAVCASPIPIYNAWFQFLENGPGLQGDGSDCSSNTGCGHLAWNDVAGQFCAFDDIIGDNKKIRVYADVAETASAKIVLQGYDENGQWIRTQVGGEWIDGEQVTISTTPTLSTKIFTSLLAVQKPITNGPVRLYEYDTDLLTQRAIAYYEPDETRPAYRRAIIPGLSNVPDGACDTKQVTVMAKLEFIPVRNDTDWLLIGNLQALKQECMAIIKQENNLLGDAVGYHALALDTLRKELRHYLGHGIVNVIRMQPKNIAGAGVPNLI